MNTDHHFAIGYHHVHQGKPCQDHALSWSSENSTMGCAVVSDGCSGGGETDVGARIMTFSLLSAVKSGKMLQSISLKERVSRVRAELESIQKGVRELLGLSNQDLYATCLFACFDEKGGFAYVCGDGVLAIVGYDGTINLWKFSWEDNMPFYPSYAGDELTEFIQKHGGTQNRCLTEECWIRLPGTEGFVKTDERMHTVAAGINGIVHEFNSHQYDTGPKFLALFTDGVAQIDNIDWKDAVATLLGFKTTEGSFAKRRLNAALIKEFPQFGKGPLDDIAYSVIHMRKDGEGS